jgi:hypothetical protein
VILVLAFFVRGMRFECEGRCFLFLDGCFRVGLVPWLVSVYLEIVLRRYGWRLFVLLDVGLFLLRS